MQLHLRLCVKYMQNHTHWPLHFNKFPVVISGPISRKQRAAFSLCLSQVQASDMNKIYVRERYHCRTLSPSFSSNHFHNKWIKWMTTVGHICIAASQQSLGNRSSSPLCCLNFPSNPSLPFPISTLHLQRPALLTKWGNRLNGKPVAFLEPHTWLKTTGQIVISDSKKFLPTVSTGESHHGHTPQDALNDI